MRELYSRPIGRSRPQVEALLSRSIQNRLTKTLWGVIKEFELPYYMSDTQIRAWRVTRDTWWGPPDTREPLAPNCNLGPLRAVELQVYDTYERITKCVPGWPPGLVIAATMLVLRINSVSGLFDKVRTRNIVEAFTIITTMLRVLRMDKTWALRIRTDDAFSTRPEETIDPIGRYTGEFFLERIGGNNSETL